MMFSPPVCLGDRTSFLRFPFFLSFGEGKVYFFVGNAVFGGVAFYEFFFPCSGLWEQKRSSLVPERHLVCFPFPCGVRYDFPDICLL